MTANAAPSTPTQRLDDLAEIIRAYNQVTENLQKSHESLQAEVVRLQEQLASTNAQLQRSKRLAALGEMAAGIAHEVRNPLAAIGLYARLIVEDLQDLASIAPPLTETTGNARKIAAAVRGLDAVVNDVLTFARDLQPKPVSVSVESLFYRVIEAHRPALDAHAIRVAMPELPEMRRQDFGCGVEGSPQAASASDLCVSADPDLFHQALANLVRNAIEAMAECRGGGERVLTLQARAEGSRVALTVGDTGPGIAPENIDRIFNPFFTTRNTGTGLGLAIVHRIIDAHGGAIAVHNDGGAVFELLVPAAVSGGRHAAPACQADELIGAMR